MRVISGKYRGRKLISPLGNDIRPTSDQVKESIFNVIQFDIAQSKFVDLFSGSGSIGIEALSRGASQVVFCDNNRHSIEVISQNLQKINDNYQIISRDYKDALRTLGGKWDYIFVDAPFGLDCINNIAIIVQDKDLLEDNGYIIYEHDKSKSYELGKDWYIAKRKTFGSIVVDYIARVRSICAVTGSFDPITCGHFGVIEKAIDMFDKVNIVIAINENKHSIFSMEQRKQLVEMCMKGCLNCTVDTWDGWTFEYCNQKGIKDIVRGYRDDNDKQYEQTMADFNYEKGGITTHFVQSKEGTQDIRSSIVKDRLSNNQSLRGLIPKDIITKVEKLYKENLSNG